MTNTYLPLHAEDCPETFFGAGWLIGLRKLPGCCIAY